MMDRRAAQLIQVCHRLSEPGVRDRELGALARAARLKRCRELLVITHDEKAEASCDDLPVRVRPAWRWALDEGS